MAHPQHEFVRQRYNFSCGYCGVSETETGGELTVDHFQPVSAGGTDDDDNLVYACFRCNIYKSDFWRDSETSLYRLLQPMRDDFSLHFRQEETTGLLLPLTETGQFHLTLLHLNRPPLVQRRLRLYLTNAMLDLHEQEIAELERIIRLQETYIAVLES
jgi:DNA-binding PadR family transcriptional regulator